MKFVHVSWGVTLLGIVWYTQQCSVLALSGNGNEIITVKSIANLLKDNSPMDEDMQRPIINLVQGSYCPKQSCKSHDLNASRFERVVSRACSSSYCTDCNCGLDCVVYGNCCPDEDLVPPSKGWTCTSTMIKSCDVHERVSSFLMYAKCPQTYTDKNTMSKCENQHDVFETIDTHIPVSSNATTFRNKYCAVCNGVDDYQTWTLSIKCHEVFHIPSTIERYIDVVDVILRKWPCTIQTKMPDHIFKNTKSCDSQTPPLQFIIRILQFNAENDMSKNRNRINKRSVDSAECTFGQVRKRLVSECNTTGHWKTYNSNIEKACGNYTLVFGNEYKNVFCFLCNAEHVYLSCGIPIVTQEPPFPGLTDILNFNTDETEREKKEVNCGRGFVFDKQTNDCLEVFCPPGRWYSDGKCRVIVRSSEVSTYSIGAVYSLQPPFEDKPCVGTRCTASDQVTRSLSASLWSEQNFLYGSRGILTAITPLIGESKTKQPDDIPQMLTLTVYGYVVYVNIIRNLVNGINVEELPNFLISHKVNVTMKGVGHTTLQYDRAMTFHLLGNKSITIENVTLNPFRSLLINRISKVDFCAYIVYHSPNFKLKDKGMYATFDSVAEIPFEEFQVVNYTTLYVCKDAYLKVRENITFSKRSYSMGQYVKGFLSVSCTCLSVVCLFITVAVYCMCKPLRTVPGLNNMCLALALMIAQLLFQFGYYQTDYDIVCRILGIVTHYSWLVVFLWMNACCIHMVRVFRGTKTYTSCGRDRKSFRQYLLYTFFVPVILVAVNVLYSLVSSDMTDMGYGGEVCFIRHKYLLAFTFALVIGSVLVFNSVLFAVVVVTIRRQSAASTFAAVDRHYLDVYFRLSTVTGMTWIWGFIYQFTGVEVFSYLFIILNASQGLLIFVAFICCRNTYSELRTVFVRRGQLNRNTAFTVSESVSQRETSFRSEQAV